MLLGMRRRTRIAIGAGVMILAAACVGIVLAGAQDQAGFPEGYDAVQAAPKSHQVIFENALVRVLQVTVPPPGQSEPMHHHRWPGFFLDWDRGGKSPHIRYHTPGGVRDVPSKDAPATAGHWSVHWMKPEPMHAIETVEKFDQPGELPLLRVEIKIPQ